MSFEIVSTRKDGIRYLLQIEKHRSTSMQKMIVSYVPDSKVKEIEREDTPDLTQADVAEKAKMSSMYYSKIERGVVKPSVDMYERIAKALKVTSSDIFPF